MKGAPYLKQYPLIQKAIEYIESHLDENINLNDVSRATGYSYYHMTRIFTAVLGESVGHYIKRRKLYKASEKLIYSNQKVIDIAIDCGFESAEAFSRAFKSVFNKSPIEYRKTGLNLVLNTKKEISPKDVFHIANNISHSPKIFHIEEITIVGIKEVTSLSDNKIPKLWQQLHQNYKDLYDSKEIGYSICETQNTIYTKDGDVLFSVMVGYPISNFKKIPPTLSKKIITGGKYAVFTHYGTLEYLYQTYQYIFGTWLQTSKETLDDREDFEVYDKEIISFDDPHNIVKLFIPIK